MMNTVYIVEYCYGSPVDGDRRTATRYSEARYAPFMEDLDEQFVQGKVSYINAYKLMYEAGREGYNFTTLLYKEKPKMRLQELNTALTQ